MPTEDETTALPHTPAIEPSSSSHTSCPPEEGREAHALREERVDGPLSQASATSSYEVNDLHETRREQPLAPDALPIPEDSSRQEKREVVEDVVDSPSPVGSSEAASDSDVRPSQSLATTALVSPNTPEETPRYLSYPSSPDRHKRLLPNSTSSFLHPGSRFRGTQQSDRQVYDVQVEIKDVNLAESFLCGYLRIQGLTDDHPTLTTFFEGEIIGPKYLFKTQHPSWNSSEKIDLQHWARFPAWRPLAKSAKNSSTFTLKNYLDREHLFMRWKEYFLVPDHRVKSISGASFEGFYYICFDQRVGSVSGIYFHAKSEKYQQLELKHVGVGGCAGAVEFR